MGNKKEEARRSGNCRTRQGVHSDRDADIVANGWTRAQCRAIGLVFCGWFVAMAILEVVL